MVAKSEWIAYAPNRGFSRAKPHKNIRCAAFVDGDRSVAIDLLFDLVLSTPCWLPHLVQALTGSNCIPRRPIVLRRVLVGASIKALKTIDERMLTMRLALEELRGIVRAYDKQWALYEHNVHRLGIEPDELRRPLDAVERQRVKSRRVRALR